MSLFNDVLTQEGEYDHVKYKVLKIGEDQFEDLKTAIKVRLAEICYGSEKIAIEPDQYTYRSACRQMYENLERYDDVKKYGLIGELLMHVLAPSFLGFSAESLSMVLALQNQNIKPGFDLNFHDPEGKRIWYGEVKSGLDNTTNRKELLTRARDGLRNYFDNIATPGENSTFYRWEAAKAEVAVMFASERRIELTRLLSDDRSMIQQQNGARRNAILMAVNFGDIAYNTTDIQDITTSIENAKRLSCFDDCIIICTHRRTFDDIIEFLRDEGVADE